MLFFLIFLLVPVALFWLIQFVDCLKNQHENRGKWIAVLLLLNVLGALYYWRMRPRNDMSQADFDNALNAWTKQMGFSLSKSNRLLGVVAQTGGRVFGLIVLVGILHVLADFIHIPESFGWFFTALILILLIWLAVLVTKTWWRREDLIVPFIADFIRHAKAGKEGDEPSFGNLPNDPIAKKPLLNLLMADFFLLFAPFFSLGGLLVGIEYISKGSGLFGVVMACAGLLVGLMFFFISIQINSKVIFYYKPGYIFKLFRAYSLWKLFLYVILMALIVGFGLVFAVLPMVGQG